MLILSLICEITLQAISLRMKKFNTISIHHSSKWHFFKETLRKDKQIDQGTDHQRVQSKYGKSNAPLRKDLLKDGGHPRQFWCDIALSEWSELSKYLELFELRLCMHIKTGRGKWRRMDPHTRENIPHWKDFMAPFNMPYLTLEPSFKMFSARDKLLYGCTADEHCRREANINRVIDYFGTGKCIAMDQMVYYKCLRSNWL